MAQKFHCALCKNVGGKDGSKYKCATHKFICDSCVTTSGFFTTKYSCEKCGKEVIRYDWDSKKTKWIQA